MKWESLHVHSSHLIRDGSNKVMIMRRLQIIFLVLSAMLIMGCKKEKPVGLDVTGTWELMDIQTKAAHIGEEIVEVVITFNADNTFSLSQMLGQGRPVTYSGTWLLEGTKLSGKYSDGKAWGTTYQVSVEGTVLTLTPEIDGAESYIYHKK